MNAIKMTSETMKKTYSDKNGLDLVRAAGAITSQISQFLTAGRIVTLFTGSSKPVRIVAVSRGMMQDAKGQRWGLLGIATCRDESERIEVR